MGIANERYGAATFIQLSLGTNQAAECCGESAIAARKRKGEGYGFL